MDPQAEAFLKQQSDHLLDLEQPSQQEQTEQSSPKDHNHFK